MTVTGEQAAASPASVRPQLAAFRERCAVLAGRDLTDPAELHRFSVEQPDDFWRAVLDASGVPWSGSAERVRIGDDVERARFFPDVRLNHAEALLRELPGGDSAPAVTSVHADGSAVTLTRGELRAAVARTSAALAGLGLAPGDRVVAIAPNHARVLTAALGVTALGAALSTATPDMGAASLLGRFAQVEPALLILDRTGMADEVATALLAGLPTLRAVLVLDDRPLPPASPATAHRLRDLVAAAGDLALPEWPRLPFDCPLFVMFSSGTTGPPKAMVHGVGGTLLEHLKEHLLHGDLRATDTLYFHTTTAWMMWNWQLSALAVGAHVVLYDGPVRGPETLWELVARHGVTVFGTSPAYLQLCQDAGYRPRDAVDLSRLRAVLSTGAVLHDWQFAWIADAVGPQPVQSISGGTDIIGCFVLGHPELPVRPGRCQTRSLGLDVVALVDGEEVVGRVGELVCRNPFPSRPLGFLHDDDGARFHAAYFAAHPGAWTHGDLIEFDAHGSARMHGRSDGVLNVDGVRIGPSEITTILRDLPDVVDSMAVEQRDGTRPGSTRLVLLVVLRDAAVLDGALERTIRRTLRRQASAAHVPALVVAVPELPLTHNGKRSEAAARRAVDGDPVPNVDALRNPGCLDAIRAAVAAVAPAAPARGPADPTGDVPEVERLWREVLGVRNVRPEDDFTDMGGTSRQAMQLLRRIWLEMGVDVSISDFSAHPTLAGLAECVRGNRDAAASRVPLLRPGRGGALFLVSDLWGQLNSYHALVQGLATERPVRGVQPDLADPDGRRRTIAEVADEALGLVRGAQPEGPYLLAGYSFGGLVAYEVACRLRTAGERVAYLCLMDVWPPTGSLTRQELLAHRFGRHAKQVRTVLSPGGPRILGQWLRELRSPAAADVEHTAYLESSAVFDDHRLSTYDGAVTYLLARRRLPVVGNSLAAWQRVAPHLLVSEVPGSHDDLLLGSTIEELTARVSATLAASG